MKVLLSHLRLWIWVLCVGCSSCLSAESSPRIDHPSSPFAGWLDSTGTATIENVQQLASWESFTGWKGWSFGPEAVWLRVLVPAASSADAPPYILIMRPPHLDLITFYDPDTGAVRRAGDFLPPVEDALGSILFTFEVPALSVERYVFVKFQSTSARVVHLSLMPLPAAQAYTRQVEWATMAVWILSVVFLLWSLAQWLRTRDRVMGIYAIKQLNISIGAFLLMGFARVTVWPWFSDGVLSMISSLLVAGSVSSASWFFAALLVEYRPIPWMLNTLRALAWVALGMGILGMAGFTQASLQTINVILPIALFWFVLALSTANSEDAKPLIPKSVLLFFASIYSILNALPPMMHLGLIHESSILFVGNISVLVFDGLVMLVILNIRQKRFKELHQAMNTQLMWQQEQARLDQQHLDDQRKLLAMLAHEVKTPLANLRIWMEAGPRGKPVMERAIHDMNHLIERCVQVGQLSEHRLLPHTEWFDAVELTHSLAAIRQQADRIHLHLPEGPCELHADVQMLSIVLSNVLENACKYSQPHTPIDVWLEASTKPEGVKAWCWRVENAVGVAGFPDADQVFDKYYRSAQAQRQSGSGLGLYLVKSLLELMKGQVTYTPLHDRIRFEVWLPCEASKSQASI